MLWDRLIGGATRAQLVAQLVEAYALDEARAQADVDAFLSSLTSHGLLERGQSGKKRRPT